MILLQCLSVLLFLVLISEGSFLHKGGRNSIDPDYDPDFMGVGDGGKNGDPSYDTGFLRTFMEDSTRKFQKWL